MQVSTDRFDLAPLIEFILQMILDAILSSNDTAQASDHVRRLISSLEQGDYTLADAVCRLNPIEQRSKKII